MNKPIFKAFLCLFLFVVLASCGGKDLYQEQQKLAGSLKSFKFEKSKNPQLQKDIEVDIFDNGNLSTYFSHNVNLTNLIPTFVIENGKLMYNGEEIESGKTTIDFSGKTSITIVGNNGLQKSCNVSLLNYTGLPVANIHTVDEQQIKNKTDWVSTYLKIDGLGLMENYEDSVFVRGRGNATWNFPKKAFNMKLANKSSILGMNKHKRWSFLANYRDRTLLRNDVALHLGDLADNLEWTPSSQFVEVIFNGEHIGNFQVTEHVRVDKKRVPIDEMESTDLDEVAITGGYLLELDSYYDEVNKFKSKKYKLPVNIKSPDEETLQPAQKEYIENYIGAIEEALIAQNYATVYNYIDMNSFVDYWMIQALCGNTEMAGPYSVFCYKKREGKLFAGPLWDFDYTAFASEGKTFNNDGRNRTTLHFNSLWYKELFKDKTFVDAVKARFNELKPEFSKISAYIDSRGQFLAASADVNWKLWAIKTSVLGVYLNGDESFATYQESIDRMKSIYEARLLLLEEEIDNL